MKFEGTAEYVATPDLTVAVNAAIALERPLLVKSPIRQLTGPPLAKYWMALNCGTRPWAFPSR